LIPVSNEITSDTQAPEENLAEHTPTGLLQDALADDDLDVPISMDEQPLKVMDAEAPLTKESSDKTQGLKSSVNAPSISVKLAKIAEDSLKDDGNDG
jgi:hypothetical protein